MRDFQFSWTKENFNELVEKTFDFLAILLCIYKWPDVTNNFKNEDNKQNATYYLEKNIKKPSNVLALQLTSAEWIIYSKHLISCSYKIYTHITIYLPESTGYISKKISKDCLLLFENLTLRLLSDWLDNSASSLLVFVQIST